ncbi:MAG: hypothetical protein WA447_11390 [Candidatus Binatus sp.]
MEGAIGGLHSQILAQYHQRIGSRVKNRLGVFAFVDRLIDTRTEGGYVRERENGAAYLVILRVRSDPQYERLIAVSKIVPRCGLGRDYVRTPPLQIAQISELGDLASGPAYVRDSEIERFCSRPVETGDAKGSVKDDDRNIDRIQDLSLIESNPVRCSGIAACRLDVGPAATCGTWIHHYRFALAPAYNLPLRSSTESETLGRT